MHYIFNVATGEPVYHLCEKGDAGDTQWIRAFALMPIVSRIVSVGGYDLLDGGVSDSIPISWFRSMGYERNIVILTRPEGYRKKKNKFFPVLKFLLRKYPKLAETLENRHEVYNSTIDELHRLEKEGDTFIITPSRDLGIPRVESDEKKLQEAYDTGVKDANDHLENIREFLSGSNENVKNMI